MCHMLTLEHPHHIDPNMHLSRIEQEPPKIVKVQGRRSPSTDAVCVEDIFPKQVKNVCSLLHGSVYLWASQLVLCPLVSRVFMDSGH